MPPLPFALRLPIAGLLPLLAILTGAWVARANGVSAKAFGVNIVAVALGMVSAGLLGRRSWNHLVRLAPVIAVTAIGLLAATLLFPSLKGVHRWLVLGPMQLNASVITLPWLLLALRVLLSQARLGLALGLVAVIQVVHIAQPDAGQATAFHAGALVLFGTTRPIPIGWGIGGGAIAAMGAVLAWVREDPLGAVPHVERILYLAADQGAPWLLAALMAQGALLLPLVYGAVWLRSSRSEAAPLAAALAVYFGGTLAVTEWGNFPVPVLGAGAGPVLGWYFVLGILRSSAQGATSHRSPTRGTDPAGVSGTC